jgi:SAM-dependent methyltransferase
MDYKRIFFPESEFGGFSDIDGIITFYNRVNSLIQASSIVLDIGCGRGSHIDDRITYRKQLRILKGKCKKVIGIDINNSAKENPFIDEFYKIEDNYWPLPDESIDIAICDAVLEHILNPDIFFSECNRVIKPNGYLCIKTTNILNYIGIMSKIIPNKFHSAILTRVKRDRIEDDVFPVYYMCNTIRKLKKMMNKYDFHCYVYGYESEPSYLKFSRFFYMLGVLYQKISPGLFKSTIFGFAQKR